MQKKNPKYNIVPNSSPTLALVAPSFIASRTSRFGLLIWYSTAFWKRESARTLFLGLGMLATSVSNSSRYILWVGEIYHQYHYWLNKNVKEVTPPTVQIARFDNNALVSE
jgi:hypothetical protein